MKIVVSCVCQGTLLAPMLAALIPEAQIVPFQPRIELSDEKVREVFSDTDIWLNEQPLKVHNERVYNIVNMQQIQEIKIPAISFNAFHPDDDFTVMIGNELFRGPGGNRHHSAIVLASWIANRPINRVKELFRRETFLKLGYLSCWHNSVKRLREAFDRCDLPFDDFFLKIQRMGNFMHDPIHPHVGAIYHLAVEICKKLFADRPILLSGITDHFKDDLRPGLVWPIYPEIAQELGLNIGSYRWWIPARFIDSLDDFIHLSYDSYREVEAASLSSQKLRDERLRETVSLW